MPRVSTKLSPRADGGWKARKRIPADVQDDYQRLYRVRWEAIFQCGPMPAAQGRARHREWLSDIEARISNIRTERKGEGRTLTPMQARGLAGEWYLWWTARHLAKPLDLASLEESYEVLGEEAYFGVLSAADLGDDDRNASAIWDQSFAARASVRAIAADHAETSQFLHSKHLMLEPATRELFLDYLCRDWFAALRLLIRRAKGDYSEDEHPKEFPTFQRTADPGLTFAALFERWVRGVSPAAGTVRRWRAVFQGLKEGFPEHSAAALTTDEVRAWLPSLITPKRSAITVRRVWSRAGKTVFAWAVEHRLVPHNPFAGVPVTVPRKISNRETKAFTEEEVRSILKAASAITELKSKADSWKRWAPWLLAYTGARAGEITQLRGQDVIEKCDAPAIRITPDAGTQKSGKPRTVPLHEHLVEQGFLAFVKRNGPGPLFYRERRGAVEAGDVTNPKRRPYEMVRAQLGEWIRTEVGIKDREVRPIHGLRHTFKQIGHRHDISERLLDAICGHASLTEGRGYGLPTLADMAEALKKFPRYEVE